MARLSSISFIVPALNEEKNILGAIETALDAGARFFAATEVLVFDDGSTDRTGQLAEWAASKYPQVRVIHHSTPKNLGGCYKEGVKLAHGEFVIMIPGDNECGMNVLEKILPLAGSADIIIPYTRNLEVRPVHRRIISRAFVSLLNKLSGYRLRYYNGTVVHRTSVIRHCAIETNSFGYQAEAIVKLLREGHSFTEVGIDISHRSHGKTKAFRLQNLIDTSKFLFSLTQSAKT